MSRLAAANRASRHALGFLPEAEARAYLQRIHDVIWPSELGGFPNALLDDALDRTIAILREASERGDAALDEDAAEAGEVTP